MCRIWSPGVSVITPHASTVWGRLGAARVQEGAQHTVHVRHRLRRGGITTPVGPKRSEASHQGGGSARLP